MHVSYERKNVDLHCAINKKPTSMSALKSSILIFAHDNVTMPAMKLIPLMFAQVSTKRMIPKSITKTFNKNTVLITAMKSKALVWA